MKMNVTAQRLWPKGQKCNLLAILIEAEKTQPPSADICHALQLSLARKLPTPQFPPTRSPTRSKCSAYRIMVFVVVLLKKVHKVG